VLKDLPLLTKDGEWGKGEQVDGLSEMSVVGGADLFPLGPHSQFAESAKLGKAIRVNFGELGYGG
jgi:hypothetical protein